MMMMLFCDTGDILLCVNKVKAFETLLIIIRCKLVSYAKSMLNIKNFNGFHDEFQLQLGFRCCSGIFRYLAGPPAMMSYDKNRRMFMLLIIVTGI